MVLCDMSDNAFKVSTSNVEEKIYNEVLRTIKEKGYDKKYKN